MSHRVYLQAYEFFRTTLSKANRSMVSLNLPFLLFQGLIKVSGVTTGFGGSANTRTTQTRTLQTSLLQMQLSAVLPADEANNPIASTHSRVHDATSATYTTLPMPETWVKAAIIVRCNSLLRGYSAVRLEVIQALINLLKFNVIPLVPLRGSISASGDLCPLA